MKAATRPDQETDAEVIERSLAEPDCFAAVFDRYYDRILGYLGRRIDLSLAEDLASEVFLIAFSKRARYDPQRRDAGPWLYGIATNQLHRHRRDEARFYQSLARSRLDLVSEDGPADRADARLTAQASRRQLAAALAELSKGDRDVLTLVAFAGLTQDDVAQVLDIPPGTVKSRLHRARARIRALFGDLDPTLAQED
jgi:RNA polymerase sigma factor (sigma-70 family)